MRERIESLNRDSQYERLSFMTVRSSRSSLVAAILLVTVSWASSAGGAQAGRPAASEHDPANLTGEQVSAQAPADKLPINHGAPALQQLLLKLRTRASLMMIVAHPDDEDGGFLTYESRGVGARVAMLTLTRGEGGQNLMSADFDDALGLIRTQELLAADRYMGVNQMFGTEVDFGFSKTKEEAFSKWTHERVLYDAVRAVRLYRPLVLASVFLGAATDGHGQHQVSGEIAQEVFTAAGDPKVFPEMIREGLLPWTPLKVYARVPFSRVTKDGMFDYATGKTIPTRFENYVTGKVTNAEPTATVKIPEGDPATVDFGGRGASSSLGMDGLTYVQFARKGLALQKTQIGPGVRPAPAGRSDTGYALMGSRLATPPTTEKSIFSGIDTSLVGIAELAPDAPKLREVLTAIDARIGEAQHLFTPDRPEAVAPPLRRALAAVDVLLAAYTKTQDIPQEQRFNLLHELRIKRVQLNDALVLADGLRVTATLAAQSEPLLSTLSAATVKVRFENAGGRTPLLLRQGTAASALPEGDAKKLSAGSTVMTRTLPFPKGLPVTRPYFSRQNPEQAYYDVSEPDLRNAPSTPPALVVTQVLDDDGARLVLKAAVTTTDAALQAAEVVPPFSVALAPAFGIIHVDARPFSVESFVREQGGNAPWKAALSVPKGWEFKPLSGAPPIQHGMSDFGESLNRPEVWQIQPHGAKLRAAYLVHAEVSSEGHTYAESYRAVGYPGLAHTNFYDPAVFKAEAVDVRTAPGLRVAYLPGTGDATADYLPDLGVTPTVITVKDLNAAELANFDAVIVGVRAYAALPALEGAGSKPLIEYARSGGVVILEYMTAKFGDAEAPYPIAVPGDSAHNVVEEARPVRVLSPESPLMNWPNKITSADFDGWVEERGHGFAATWAPQYQALLEAEDVGQDPQRGGLLLAPVGKGAYVYCALALYRQLPDGVPGAYRLLANLISYAKNPERPSGK